MSFGISIISKYQLMELLMKSIWGKAIELTEFVYHWRAEKAPKTSFRGLWDEAYFYFLYVVNDDGVYLVEDASLDEEKQAVNSDRIEIFFRSADLSLPYYALEMDAKARTFDSKGTFQKRIAVDWLWDWPEGHLILKSTIQENGYTVEGKISISSLKELSLLNDGYIHAGLYRGEYIPTNEEKPIIKWISWVKSDSPKPNFHLPSSFGVLKLEE